MLILFEYGIPPYSSIASPVVSAFRSENSRRSVVLYLLFKLYFLYAWVILKQHKYFCHSMFGKTVYRRNELKYT